MYAEGSVGEHDVFLCGQCFVGQYVVEDPLSLFLSGAGLYLSETIKAVSKRTPNEWIDSYVTIELRMLLRNTQKSIKEIAQELNFSNQSFLGKYFKEHTGSYVACIVYYRPVKKSRFILR